jgi:hypothetical protein
MRRLKFLPAKASAVRKNGVAKGCSMIFRGLLACAMLCEVFAFGQAPSHQVPQPRDPSDHLGWTSLFDGNTLAGWEGDTNVWHAKDDAIVCQIDNAPQTRDGQTFLTLLNRQPKNFELTLDVKIEGVGADSGIQFRSYRTTPRSGSTLPQDPKWYVGGYQFDLDFVNIYNGQVAEGSQLGRGIIATRGQLVHAEKGKTPELTAALGTPEELGGYYRINDWNHIHLIARDRVLIQIINGHVTGMLIDDDDQYFKAKGLIALQCAGKGSVRLSFRDLWLKEFKD